MGITAPSSGVRNDMHEMFKLACSQMESRGYSIVCGDTVWTQDKAKSAPAKQRADEFNTMMQNEQIDIVIPPWGGELLIEILEHVDFDNIQPKWILGYSDISLLLLVVTLRTGIATAHGPGLLDLRGERPDTTTAMWESVLSTKVGDSIIQCSSDKYQKEWPTEAISSPQLYNLTEETHWLTTSKNNVKLQGRLLGGCIDVIRHVIGTSYGDVEGYRRKYIDGEPILWYLENCELNTADVRRSLVQMKLAGWFDHCSGIMFGRSEANRPVNNYVIEDVYNELADELQLPIVYDIDFGHVPPQVTLINGAYAEIEVDNGKGRIVQYFK